MKELKRRFRIVWARIKRKLGLVRPDRDRWESDKLKILRRMTGGPLCYKHLEQCSIDKLKALKLEEYLHDDQAEVYQKFIDQLDIDLARMVKELRRKGIKIGMTLSEGTNPKKFYYIIETKRNMKRIRKLLGF